MKIVITGINGFVGTHLKNAFLQDGHEVFGIDKEEIEESDKYLRGILSGSDIIINLAGVPVVGRWTDSYKETLWSSRIETTSRIVALIGTMENRPKLFISTSAVGVYDNREEYSEDGNFSNDFLSSLCQKWEDEAQKVSNFGVREVRFRFGVVLGRDGGALKQMLTPFKMGVGGKIGDGKQAVSFIHIEDLISAYKFVIENESLSGVFNLTAPNPATNLEMTKALGKALHRPTIFPLPEFVLKLIYGEGAKVLTDGQSVVPKRLLDAGFKFQFETIDTAISNLIE